MDIVLSVAVGVVAAGFGWFAAGLQHLLYRLPEQREARARGGKLLALRLFLAASCGLVGGLAFRPDHFEAGPAALSVAFGLVLCVIASTDFDRRLIPDRISLPAMAAALAFSWAWPDRSVSEVLFGGAFALGIAVALVVLGVIVGGALGVRTLPFGIGDAKLILVLGLVLGWPAVMSALLYGIVIAGLVGVIILFRRGARSLYAYGPYLALGGIVVLLWPGRFT